VLREDQLIGATSVLPEQFYTLDSRAVGDALAGVDYIVLKIALTSLLVNGRTLYMRRLESHR